MSKMVGFVELQSAHDLLGKLQFDFDRLEADPRSTYAAFDFFVTADHMVDWWRPDLASRNDQAHERKKIRDKNPDLWVAYNISNGAKHFKPMATANDKVTAVDFFSGLWEAGVWAPNVWGKGVWGKESGIWIEKSDGSEILALDLADELLRWWGSELA